MSNVRRAETLTKTLKKHVLRDLINIIMQYSVEYFVVRALLPLEVYHISPISDIRMITDDEFEAKRCVEWMSTPQSYTVEHRWKRWVAWQPPISSVPGCPVAYDDHQVTAMYETMDINKVLDAWKSEGLGKPGIRTDFSLSVGEKIWPIYLNCYYPFGILDNVDVTLYNTHLHQMSQYGYRILRPFFMNKELNFQSAKIFEPFKEYYHKLYNPEFGHGGSNFVENFPAGAKQYAKQHRLDRKKRSISEDMVEKVVRRSKRLKL